MIMLWQMGMGWECHTVRLFFKVFTISQNASASACNMWNIRISIWALIFLKLKALNCRSHVGIISILLQLSKSWGNFVVIHIIKKNKWSFCSHLTWIHVPSRYSHSSFSQALIQGSQSKQLAKLSAQMMSQKGGIFREYFYIYILQSKPLFVKGFKNIDKGGRYLERWKNYPRVLADAPLSNFPALG